MGAAKSPLLLFGTIAFLGVSCAGDPMIKAREEFALGRYPEAHAEISRLIDDDPSNAHVYRLERSVVSLALGSPRDSIADLRAARDRLDDLRSGKDYAGWFTSVMLDDRQLEYDGADYEHVLVRAMLALADLAIEGSSDARAYALQVSEKQEEIIQGFQAEDGSRPKEGCKLVAFGSYLRGIMDEERLQPDLARRSFERVKAIEPSFPYVDDDLRRVTEGVHSERGNGVIWILGLVGRGPFRIEVDEPVSKTAFAMAQLIWALARDRATIPNITDVKIPALALHPDSPTELHVAVDGIEAGVTATVTDVNATALSEFEAMREHIVARAVIRRAFKVIVTEAAKEAVRAGRGRGRYESQDALIDIGISALGMLWTGLEGADLRCWSLLPARIQARRIEVPAGEHVIEARAGLGGRALGAPQTCRVLVRDGFNTYVLVQAPTPAGGPPPLSSAALAVEPGPGEPPPPEEVP